MHWSLVYLISEWSIRLVMLVYVPQRRSAAATRTWLLLIFLLPWPGLVLYALFGRIYVPHRRIEQQDRASHKIRAVQAQMGVRPLPGHSRGQACRRIFHPLPRSQRVWRISNRSAAIALSCSPITRATSRALSLISTRRAITRISSIIYMAMTRSAVGLLMLCAEPQNVAFNAV
jgi:hypothetical protein